MEDEGAGPAGTTEFLGQYRHTLDVKGRVILPSAFRPQLEKGLVMTIGQDHCLAVHPQFDWARVKEGLRALRTTDRRERQFVRMITAYAHKGELDRQGRITIPGHLRGYAGLAKDVTVVGADARVELWDTASWERYREQGLAEFASTDQPFDLGGIF